MPPRPIIGSYDVDSEAAARDAPLCPDGGVVRDPRAHSPRDHARPAAARALCRPRARRCDAARGSPPLRRRHAASRRDRPRRESSARGRGFPGDPRAWRPGHARLPLRGLQRARAVGKRRARRAPAGSSRDSSRYTPRGRVSALHGSPPSPRGRPGAAPFHARDDGPAHRPPEPRGFRRPGPGRARTRGPHGPWPRPRDARPRPLQELQRPLRASRGRCRSDGRRGHHRADRPWNRRGGPLRGRGVHRSLRGGGRRCRAACAGTHPHGRRGARPSAGRAADHDVGRSGGPPGSLLEDLPQVARRPRGRGTLRGQEGRARPRRRRENGAAKGAGGRRVTRPMAWVLALLALQVVLGGVTVLLKNVSWTVVVHYGAAALLVGSTMILAVRLAYPASEPAPHDSFSRLVGWFVALSLGLLLAGSTVANTDSHMACGHTFLSCNGSLAPALNHQVIINLIHRVWAGAMLVLALWVAFRSRHDTVDEIDD